MSIAKSLTTALTASLLFGVALPSAQAANKQTCVFDKYAPIAAAPYVAENSIGYGTYTSLGGAQLFVPAREGLTKEWLTASVQQAIAAGQLSSDNQSTATPNAATCDSPRVKDVSVSVVSGGNGYWIQLTSQDNQSSEALLKWARSIVKHR